MAEQSQWEVVTIQMGHPVQVFPVINFNLSHSKIETIRGILTIEPLTGVTDKVGVWGQYFDIISICI